MNQDEAFKLGFLSRCLEEGLSPAETNQLAKLSSDYFEKQASAASSVGSVLGSALSGASNLAGPALALGLAAPPALGGISAYFYNKALDTDSNDAVDEIKKQELVETYRRMADQLRRAKSLRERKLGAKKRNQVFL